MAAREDQAQPVIRLARHLTHRGSNEQGQLAVVVGVPAEVVQRFAASGRHQPGPGPVGNALLWPMFERRDHGLLDQLLTQVKVAQETYQCGGELAGLLTKNG